MTTKNANSIRARWADTLLSALSEMGEDAAFIASGTLNFPVVADDGEEGFVEIVVKIPKETPDDDGYAKREAYTLHLSEKAAKKAEADKKKAEKMERDRKAREAKAAAKAAKAG